MTPHHKLSRLVGVVLSLLGSLCLAVFAVCQAQTTVPAPSPMTLEVQPVPPALPDHQAVQFQPTPRSSMSSQPAASRNEQQIRQRAIVSETAVHQAIAAYNRGVDAAGTGRYEEAIEAYRAAIGLNPNLIEAYNNLAYLLERVQRYQDALLVYKQALDRHPKEPLLHRNIGIVYEKVGNTTAALASYRTYLKLTKTPDPRIESIVEQYHANHQSASRTQDYAGIASEGSDGRLLLWPSGQIPIPICIVVDVDQAPFVAPIKQAMTDWEAATHGRVRFKEVPQLLETGIFIRLNAGPLTHESQQVGHARFDVNPTELWGRDGFLMNVNITLNTGEREAPIPQQVRMEKVHQLALHELGHAIGIWGHSDNPDDIMYSRPIVNRLSLRDKNTIQALYANSTVNKRFW